MLSLILDISHHKWQIRIPLLHLCFHSKLSLRKKFLAVKKMIPRKIQTRSHKKVTTQVLKYQHYSLLDWVMCSMTYGYQNRQQVPLKPWHQTTALNGVTSHKTIILMKLQTTVCICVLEGMIIWDNVLNKLVWKSELDRNGLGYDLGTRFCDYYDKR